MLLHLTDLQKLIAEFENNVKGDILDLYFDDLYWNIQSMVIRTGKLYDQRTILLSHVILDEPDIKNKVLPVSVSLDIGKKSEKPDNLKPISEAKKEHAYKVLSWPLNRLNLKSLNEEELNNLVTNMAEDQEKNFQKTNPHLRSCNEVLKYNIHAKDGEIGHVDDFILDTRRWKIRYLKIDTRNWLPGGKEILISPAWIEKIKWNENLVYIDLNQDAIKDSPEYDANKPLDDAFELKLFKYYGQQRIHKSD